MVPMGDCQYCGDALPSDPSTLNIKIRDPDDAEWRGYYAHYEFCSEECNRDARTDRDWMTDPENRRRNTVHKSEVEL